MKELKQLSKDKVVITKQAQQEKQLKLVGRIRPHKGHTIYEVDLSTGNVMEAEFEEAVATYKPAIEGRSPRAHVDRFNAMAANPVSRKLKVNENCIYVSVLNLKTLMKKLVKTGIIYPEADAK